MDALIAPAASFFLIFILFNLVVALFVVSKRKLKSQNLFTTSSESKDLERAALQTPPGPTPVPVLGNLHQLAKYEENPYAGFTELSKSYGSVFKLQMGAYPCIIVSELDDIMEVLIKKGQHFDGRPNFMRWNAYFDGDRQLSLALCDWSDIQKTRRNVVRPHLMLKHDAHKNELFSCLESEMHYLIDEIDRTKGKGVMAKLPISYCAMNVFLTYMCSTRFDYSDSDFTNLTKCFDLIFEDINNGHPTDFLPWLSPFYASYRNKINDLASTIRKFILEKIIRDRADNFDGNNINDLVDSLLANHLNQDGKLNLDWQIILFALEDLLGGSSAISNVVMRILALICQNPGTQEKLQKEIDDVLGSNRFPTAEDRSKMTYSEAVIMEALRHTSSPIVPHVANEDTSIKNFFVEKGSVVLINNYEINMSSSLWDNPKEFIPERFIVKGQIKKPVHFMPFSTGKRSCIGSRIFMNVAFFTIVSLLQRFNISLPEGAKIKIPQGRIALEGDGFPVIFTQRT
ncbi:Cytochrome P450 [Armadillidium nasatum]|uniref:Cytochrome P450 n=1 Tax=Armadillidium nasatum TaxID=96803 RepID=A0A5N5TFC6_9CRUS|nr:Cytochrome P450 [Armadillidium nasatum]